MPFNIKRADISESIRPAVSAVYDFLTRLPIVMVYSMTMPALLNV
jgi:hypothetical protein